MGGVMVTWSYQKAYPERGGNELMPEMGYKPVNRYLPPRAAKKNQGPSGMGAALSRIATEDAPGAAAGSGKFLRWDGTEHPW